MTNDQITNEQIMSKQLMNKPIESQICVPALNRFNFFTEQLMTILKKMFCLLITITIGAFPGEKL